MVWGIGEWWGWRPNCKKDLHGQLSVRCWAQHVKGAYGRIVFDYPAFLPYSEYTLNESGVADNISTSSFGSFKAGIGVAKFSSVSGSGNHASP